MSLIQAVLIEHGFTFDSDLPEVDKWFPIICAYHGESRPSAAVNPVVGGFRCMACHKKGNAFTLVREWGELDNGAARSELERIAEEYGKQLPSTTTRKRRRYGVLDESRVDASNHRPVRPRFRR